MWCYVSEGRVGRLQVVKTAEHKLEQGTTCQVTQKQWGAWVTGSCLKPSYLLYLVQIRLKQHSKISLLRQVSLSESLGQQKEGELKFH